MNRRDGCFVWAQGGEDLGFGFIEIRQRGKFYYGPQSMAWCGWLEITEAVITHARPTRLLK